MFLTSTNDIFVTFGTIGQPPSSMSSLNGRLLSYLVVGLPLLSSLSVCSRSDTSGTHYIGNMEEWLVVPSWLKRVPKCSSHFVQMSSPLFLKTPINFLCTGAGVSNLTWSKDKYMIDRKQESTHFPLVTVPSSSSYPTNINNFTPICSSMSFINFIAVLPKSFAARLDKVQD